MRSSRKQAEHNHDRIVQSAARLARKEGIGQTVVADVMRAAGMTHGGFYRHFDNKEALIAAALDASFDESVIRMTEVLETSPVDEAFARQRQYYLSEEHVHTPEQGCPVPALGSEAARLPSELKEHFGRGVERMVAKLAEGLTGSPGERRKRAYRELAMMAGALMIARASPQQTAAAVLHAVRESAASPPNENGAR